MRLLLMFDKMKKTIMGVKVELLENERVFGVLVTFIYSLSFLFFILVAVYMGPSAVMAEELEILCVFGCL